MPSMDPCPPIFELEQFLLGQLADEESLALEAHLILCSECQKKLPKLTAEDEFVKALRTRNSRVTNGEPKAEPDIDLVKLLVPHFKQIATAFEETTSLASGFATPSQSPSQNEFWLWNTTDDSGEPRCLGRYEIRRVLGSGGMGTVIQAYDPLLKRSVAIKLIHSKLLADAGVQDRLVREAQAAAAVEHDNIVSVFAVEMHQGDPYIVMPLLHGMTLQQHLEETTGPLPLREIMQISRETSRGLAAAHAVGLIHCDIKPANLWLEVPTSRVKILDFGLAVVSGDKEGRPSGISGTPGYLAPEQARGLPLDQRTDVFSLGCVLYRMATGLAPFTGEKQMRALWTVLSTAPTPVLQLNPQVPLEFSNLIGRMLAQDPNQRPTGAAAIVDAIDSIERQIVERKNKLLRRQWLGASLVATLLTGSGVWLWATRHAPPVATPVEMTLIGDEPPIAITLRHSL